MSSVTFIPRAWEDLTTEMVAWLGANPDVLDGAIPTDLVPGSLELAHVEAFCVQVEGFEHRTAEAMGRAISESAYHAFGFDLLPAIAARGNVVFSRFDTTAGAKTIPAGSLIFSVTGSIFETTQDGLIQANNVSSAGVPVVCQEPGVAGNLPAATLTRLATGGIGVDQVTNLEPTGGGSDEENEESRAARFNAFIQTIPRGTAYALEYAALSSGLVAAVKCVDPTLLDPRPTGIPYSGTVWLFCDAGDYSGTLSADTLAQLKRLIYGYHAGSVTYPGWKAAGVHVDILPSVPLKTKVRGRVTVQPGGPSRWNSIKTNLRTALDTFFTNVLVGDSVSYRDLTMALQLSDPDVVGVILDVWPQYGLVPSATGTPTVVDMDPYNPLIPLSLGWRPMVYTGTDPDGFEGASVDYPEWIMVEGA